MNFFIKAVLAWLIVGMFGVQGNSASALVVDNKCQDVETIFARGSGQNLNGKELNQFQNQFTERIAKNGITLNHYELGTETYNGASYPAVNVVNIFTGGGAILSGGKAFEYGDSVSKGKKEFKAYLEKRMQNCPNAQFVVGGYSQGAQVIREGLAQFTNAQKQRIVFVALFGDPKLYLPEGEGSLTPPACRGANLSLYRRVIGDCKADNGSLGAQKPFLSSNLDTKTGLWCNAHDFICGTTKIILDNEGHGKYAESGKAIDLAVMEIAEKVKPKLPPAKAALVDAKPKQGNAINGHDVVFVVDVNLSMAGKFPAIKASIRASAEKLLQNNGRFSIALYGANRLVGHIGTTPPPGGVETFVINTRFEDDPQEVLQALDSVVPFSTEPSPPLEGLTVPFANLHWREGAVKSAILFTNAQSYQDPDYKNITSEQVLGQALEIDPVSIFPIVPESSISTYHELADKSSGRVFVDDEVLVDGDDTVYQTIMNRPVVLFRNTEYIANPGQEITFDVSDSYVIDSEITKYEWDFDGDLIFDAETAVPSASHTYNSTIDGVMQVRATAANGMVANGSTRVKVGTKIPSALPASPSHLKVMTESDTATSVTLSWDEAGQPPASWAISVNGIVVGTIAGNRTAIEITEINRSEDVTFSVAGVSADNEVGDAASVLLAKPTPPAPLCSTGNFFQDIVCKLMAWYHALQQQLAGWYLRIPQ